MFSTDLESETPEHRYRPSNKNAFLSSIIYSDIADIKSDEIFGHTWNENTRLVFDAKHRIDGSAALSSTDFGV